MFTSSVIHIKSRNHFRGHIQVLLSPSFRIYWTGPPCPRSQQHNVSFSVFGKANPMHSQSQIPVPCKKTQPAISYTCMYIHIHILLHIYIYTYLYYITYLYIIHTHSQLQQKAKSIKLNYPSKISLQISSTNRYRLRKVEGRVDVVVLASIEARKSLGFLGGSLLKLGIYSNKNDDHWLGFHGDI